MEELALEPELARSPVRRVAGDRQADRGEVHADLVRAARLERHAQKRVARAAARRPRSASPRHAARRCRATAAARRAGHDRSAPRSCRARERGRPTTSARYSRVTSRAFTISWSRRCASGPAGDDEQARRVAVEPVDDARPVRLVPALDVVGEQPVHERAASRGPAPGWTTRPAGLSTTRRCSSSYGIARSMACGTSVDAGARGRLELELLAALEPVALGAAASVDAARRSTRAAARPPRASRSRAARRGSGRGARPPRRQGRAVASRMRRGPRGSRSACEERAEQHERRRSTMKLSARLNAGQ